jgi:hypothetical protein
MYWFQCWQNVPWNWKGEMNYNRFFSLWSKHFWNKWIIATNYANVHFWERSIASSKYTSFKWKMRTATNLIYCLSHNSHIHIYMKDSYSFFSTKKKLILRLMQFAAQQLNERNALIRCAALSLLVRLCDVTEEKKSSQIQSIITRFLNDPDSRVRVVRPHTHTHTHTH